MIIQRKSPALILFPVKVFISFAMLYHGNAIVYRADQLTKIATNTFFINDSIGIIRLTVFQFNGLMRCVLAGDKA